VSPGRDLVYAIYSRQLMTVYVCYLYVCLMSPSRRVSFHAGLFTYVTTLQHCFRNRAEV